MRSSSFRSRVRCVFFLALLLGVLQVGAQDYEAQFVKGVTAMDSKSWNEAITYFRAAIAARPRESTDLVQIYGMRTRPYLPHYYLGVAYANSSNCVAALEQFAESEQQGAIQRAGEYRNLQRLREKCPAVTVRATEPPPPTTGPVVTVAPPPSPVVPTQIPLPTQNDQVPQALRDAQAEVARAVTAATVEGRVREDAIKSGIWRKNPSLQAREKAAKDDLAAARVALDEGKAGQSLSKLRSARNLAARARTEFGDLESTVVTLTEAVPSPPPSSPPPQVAAAVPPALLEGARAYFAGEYAKAARTLEAAPDFSERRAVAEARLFRSAARYALYLTGGGKDNGLQQQALQDAAECRRLDPQLSPNRKFFSPRFVRFFKEVADKPSRPSA